MFYKKLILSILLFASCSMNAMSNQTPSNNEDKRFFLMRWYKVYEKYIFNNGASVSILIVPLHASVIGAGMFTLLWKLFMILEEKNVGKDPAKLAALYKQSSYVSLKKWYRICGGVTLGLLTTSAVMVAPFFLKEWMK